MLVGLSLSFCIRDIIDGKMALSDVHHIVCGTKAKDREAFDRVCAGYAAYYWCSKPTLAQLLALSLWNEGKLVQPRLLDKDAPYIGQGVWLHECPVCGTQDFWVSFCHTCGHAYGSPT